MLKAQRLVIAIALAFLVVSCSTTAPELQPELNEAATETISDRYIVVLHLQFAPGGHATNRTRAADIARQLGVAPRYAYGSALFGFAAAVPEGRLDALRRDPRVAYVEADSEMRVFTTQNEATWGLDRIDQRALPLNGGYRYDASGSGVNSYVIDTGILLNHVDFGGRAVTGFDAITAGGNASDCNGHGTHVAGTMGGREWGVAKSTTLIAVRVLDCNGSGTTSGVIAGVDWVTANHVKPAVANMSLGGGASTSLDNAVKNSIAAGVTYSVAAGNGDRLGRQADACNYSPARVREALTVGATTNADAKTSWSNYGTCVDLFAPGASITSAWHTSSTATNTISGTSMAAPHVAGVAALYLEANPSATPAAVFKAVFDNTTKNIVTSSSTTNNHLLYSLFTSSGTEPDPTPKPGAINLSATGYKVSGLQKADLSWTGATSASVDIFRNSSRITTTANSDAYTDNINRRGSGSYTYKVCEAGTTTCSNSVTVTF